MKVYLAICHSNAYYDEYEQERIIGVYKDRNSAVNDIFRDMLTHNSDNASYEDLIERRNHLYEVNGEGLYGIIEMELKWLWKVL